MPSNSQNAVQKVRVFLVDDEPVVRRGLTLFLGRQPNLVMCGEAGNLTEALTQIPLLAPELVILDLTLRNEDGIGLIGELRQRYPRLKILVFSMHGEVTFAQAALSAGAQGYVVKEEGTESLLEAIGLVMAGKFYVSPSIAAQMPEARPGVGPGARKMRH